MYLFVYTRRLLAAGGPRPSRLIRYVTRQNENCWDKDRRYLVYRGTVDPREVVVIWRETKDWGKDDFERDKMFVVEQKLTKGADEVFVNSDSFIPGARSLDPIFKARMFAPLAANGGN